jgi:hypothetical protein
MDSTWTPPGPLWIPTGFHGLQVESRWNSNEIYKIGEQTHIEASSINTIFARDVDAEYIVGQFS